MNKFARIHHLINIATDRRSTDQEKLLAMDAMSTEFDDETREHFRMGLAHVLRDKRNKRIVRKQALSLLSIYFEWHEIEWTFYLHETREYWYQKKNGVWVSETDMELLKTYGEYCRQKKHNHDGETMSRIIAQTISKAMAVPQ